MLIFQVALGALGATLIVTRSKLFYFLRERVNFFSCDQCVGFWLGLGLSTLYLAPKFCLLSAVITSAFGFITSRQYPQYKGNTKIL